MAATLMYIRLLDFFVQNESDIQRKELPEQMPDAAAWLNLLGSVAGGRHAESGAAEKFLRPRGHRRQTAKQRGDYGWREVTHGSIFTVRALWSKLGSALPEFPLWARDGLFHALPRWAGGVCYAARNFTERHQLQITGS